MLTLDIYDEAAMPQRKALAGDMSGPSVKPSKP